MAHVPLIKLPRWPQLTSSAEEAVPPDSDRDRIPVLLARIAGWECAQQITTDDDFGLDDCLAAEDDVRGADDLGATRYLVSSILVGVSW